MKCDRARSGIVAQTGSKIVADGCGEFMKRGLRRSILVVLVAIQFLVGSAGAADKLQADLRPVALRVRSEAPIPVEVRFEWDGTHILQGRLEVELHEGNRILARYRSDDLALTTGERSFRMLLPPSLAPFAGSQVEAQMKFVTAGEVLDLGSSVLFMSTLGERSLAVAWCNARTGTEPQSSRLEQTMLFERFTPQSANVARRSLITSMVRMAPEDLPSQPLSYTSFDMVVLTADGFAEAREGQLRALARWVKGGGSVCVLVGGGLRSHHLWFLNELAESTANGAAFLSGNDGNLLPSQNKVWCLHSGVGRSVVITGNVAADPALDSSVWRQAVAFLWKFRGSRVRTIAETGHWEMATNYSTESSSSPPAGWYPQGRNWQRRWPASGRAFQEMQSYSVQPTQTGAELMNQLMPKTVRLIPFGALIGTLGLFLLMIGPVDYFVLGWLRRRRYTWVLFPITSIGFTVATILMANYYLGQRDQRRSLIVVDVGKDGTALRWNRYELIFAARDKEAVTELKDALWAPLNFAAPPGMPYNFAAPPGMPYNPGYRYVRRDVGREASPPWYNGVLPVHFQTSESIHQWRPELNRIFSFESPPAPLLPNWREVEEAWPDLQNIRAKLSVGKPFTGDVCMISSTNWTFDSSSSEILSGPILQELCAGDSTGLLSLVSQVSPTGGGNFEDVQGMDTETNDSVLAIVTHAGDDIVVYRRFFYGN
jgi:hypothetical protein